MRFEPTKLAGVFIVRSEQSADERGIFYRSFCQDSFAKAGLIPPVLQSSLSINHRAGCLRGMHYQRDPGAETKLVRCVAGAIWDVAVDLRPGSPTHRHWVATELSAANGAALYIPPGCAHGFLTLEDDAHVLYQMDAAYRPELAAGVRWNDPAFAIAWPGDPVLLSTRDRDYPDYDR